MPLTIGWLRPAIVLPSDWSSWSDPMLAAVLAHEQAHVLRRDPWVALLAQANRAIYWFHPLAWFLVRRLTALSESACDDAVIESLGDRTGYARHLLAVASRLAGQSRRVEPLGVAMAARSTVEHRIEAILDMGRPLARRVTLAGTLALVAIAVPLLFLAASLRAEEGQTADAPIDSKADIMQSTVERPIAVPDGDAQDNQHVLSGRIIDESGAPVTDAIVEITGTQARKNNILDHLEAKTDEQGRYHFDKIGAGGEFSLRITSIQWVGITDWKTLPRMNLTPTSRVVHDVTLKLACQIGVMVVDEAGNPIENAQLYTTSLADDRHSSSNEVSTSKFGLANIGGLQPATVDYIVGAYHDDYGYANAIVPLREAGAVAVQKIVLSKGVEVVGVALCSDGKPAAGWKVYALPSWWRFGISHRGAEIGKDGTFKLTHIVPDTYDLNVHIPSGGGMSRVEVASTATKLPANSDRVQLQLRSESPQSMSAIAGKIRYLGKEPPNGFWIFANSMEGGNHVSVHVDAGATEFRISPVPRGTYRVSIEDTQIEPVTILDVAAPTSDLELKVRAVEPPELRGAVVRQQSGEPVRQFRVRVEKLRTLRGPNHVQEPRWYDFDDSAGRFEIQIAGPGIYRVLVDADGCAWTRSQEANSDEDASHNIRVELSPGAELTGTVVNEQGEPIDGATVLPLSKASGSMGELIAKFATADGGVKTVDGKFTLANLSVGKETLKIAHPDYCFAIVENIDVPTGGGSVAPITLTRGGTIQGHIYDADGQPEGGVTLYFQDDYAYNGGGDDEAGRLGSAVSDANGFYEVRGLPEELCYVHRQEEWSARGVVRQAVLPKNGATRTVDFGGATPVKGRLLLHGEPLADTRLELGGDNPTFGIFKAFGQTDSNGSFTFWGPPAGKWTLYYLLPGQRSDWCRVTDVQVTGAEIDLGTIDFAPVQLTVQVRGEHSTEVRPFQLSLQDYNPIWPFGNRVGEVKSSPGEEGQYRIENVPSGEYELICRREDGLQLRQKVEIQPGPKDQQIAIEWPAANASVGGQYHGADGRPNLFSPPNLWSKDRRLHRVVMGDDDNRYHVENLPAGDYYLTDKDTRDAAPVVEFSLAEGEQKTLDLTSDVYTRRPFAGGLLMLMIFTDRGMLLPGCDLTLTGPGGSLSPHSSQYGQLTFVGAPGTYRMKIEYPGFRTVERDVELKREMPNSRSFVDTVMKITLQSSDVGSPTN